jgi:hypothetical protein
MFCFSHILYVYDEISSVFGITEYMREENKLLLCNKESYVYVFKSS